jgi:formate hydrogenlyase subunit 3/multisubunit Na+/H+ antiporter MnhD subunit
MQSRPTKLLRGFLLGIASGGIAFLIVFFLGDALPPKVHAWFLLAVAGFSAISETYFKSLLSELSALLRRGTYSVWQLEQLDQTVPQLRKLISFAWVISMGLKVVVGLACALLLWDGLPSNYSAPVMFMAYALLIYSFAFVVWGRQNFRKLEREVDALTLKEATLKEKRRLTQSLESGTQHDFTKDELAKGYTRPPISL